MAVFPNNAIIRLSGFSEEFDSSVERVEMERGVPKQRVINSQVMATITATVLFKAPEDISAFEEWYFGELGRVGWFTFAHPRTGEPLTVRFVGGQIGTLTAQAPRGFYSQRQVTLEYLR